MNHFCRNAWVTLLLLACAARAQEPVVLTNISEVRALSREQAKKNFPVQVRGVVTWSGGPNWFIVQDTSGGITVNVGLARRSNIWLGDAVEKAAAIGVGNEVEIDGVAHAAGFAPDILPKTLKVLGKKPLPPARLMVPARFFTGSDACERIEVRGVVQGFQQLDNNIVTFQVDANPGSFTVEADRSVVNNPRDLVDAEVRLRGVAGTSFNSRGEVVGARLRVSGAICWWRSRHCLRRLMRHRWRLTSCGLFVPNRLGLTGNWSKAR
jgi:hypothetical protein